MKKWMISCLFVFCAIAASAQTNDNVESHTIVNKSVEEQSVVSSNHQVITNFFRDNWFALGDLGVNAFWGDYTVGNLGSRLTPQFNLGFGKWFVPGFGAKLQFTGFTSKESKSVETVNTRYSETFYDKNGNPFWTEKIKWWDINANLMFNISRMITGYEGIGSPALMNQFIASIGLGVTHIQHRVGTS